MLITPPHTPLAPAYTTSPPSRYSRSSLSPTNSPEFGLPASLTDAPDFSLPGPSYSLPARLPLAPITEEPPLHSTHTWRPDLSPSERDARESYLADGKGRGLRIVIVTENFLPKVDGVTRTLARLLEHLQKEGHQCMLLGPETGMGHYATHPLVGTAGVPLVVYPGLKLNFLRPKFMRTIKDFQPDVVHFVDPIWLGAQTLIAMELGWAGEEWVSEDGPAMGAGIRGAVVASYHTNLATYATLFGMAWLTPIMWKLQSWLYSKTILTLCPSPSTQGMLQGQGFSRVRLWPRGVDLTQFGPSKRCSKMRASWGVGEVAQYTASHGADNGTDWQGRRASFPLTPPLTPWSGPVDDTSTLATETNPPATATGRIVLLYVGRISWEKNLHLLLAAYARLPSNSAPKLVFVGDGPARVELEAICAKAGHDAVFMGHRSGADLARCYASADVFAFPSFTETFGQVVLEALASGLPVVGLDAEGTRDLVQHEQTGLLLSLPEGGGQWPMVCRDQSNLAFIACAERYASLLFRLASNHDERYRMGKKACTEGIEGYTWWDAMERCVDGYRESMRIARDKRIASSVSSGHSRVVSDTDDSSGQTPNSPRISRVNRVVSRRLAHKGAWADTSVHAKSLRGGFKVSAGYLQRAKVDTSETIWHLKTLLKLVIAIGLLYGVYSHHVHVATRVGVVAGDASNAFLS